MSESHEDHPEVSLHPPSIFISALLIGFIMRVFLGGFMSLVPGVVGEGIGGAMMVAALMLAVASISTFAEAGETLRPATPSRQLFTEGPYRRSRNPIYLAMTLFGVGFGVATLDLWIILASLCAAALINFLVIPQEEAYLARRFGAEYALYRERTRRWL